MNLLHRGADLHLADKMGWTPLFWACMEGHVNIAQMLIKRGADPSGLDNGKATCLHYAAMEGHIEVVRLLIDSGVDISIKDHINQSPVQAACVHGHEECALELMERGADFTLPDGMDASNLSPLAQGNQYQLNSLDQWDHRPLSTSQSKDVRYLVEVLSMNLHLANSECPL